jgi:hypothetical protein
MTSGGVPSGTDAFLQNVDHDERGRARVRGGTRAAAADDRGGAEYKFFRSSVFVFFVAAVVLWRQTPIGSGISVVLAIFCCWEFLYLRWINELFTYQYFLILHYSLEKGASL